MIQYSQSIGLAFRHPCQLFDSKKGKRKMNSGLKYAFIALAAVVSVGFTITSIFGLWWLPIYILFISIPFAFVFAAWQLAKVGVFFTFVGTGKIKTIDRGKDNLIMILENIDGYGPDARGHIVLVPGGDKKTWLQNEYGLFWIGIPPAKVHKFEFIHQRLNPNINDDTPSSQWIVRDNAPQETDELLWEIPHTYRVTGVELKDGFHVDLLFNTRSRTISPEIALYLRGGKFIDYQAQYVEAGVNSVLSKLESVFFREADKSEGSVIAEAIIKAINESTGSQAQPLLDAVGMEVVGGFISRWQPSDRSEEEALRKMKKATLEGEAAVELARLDADKATQEARRIGTISQAEAQADATRAKGQTAGLEAALETIKRLYPDLDNATALREANALAIAIKMSDKDSPVTVIGAGVNIGVTPDRKDK